MAADDTVTENNLGDKILDAAKTSLGSRFTSVKTFAKAEAETLAITLRMIIEASAANDISKAEAKILVNQQKLAASAVLTAVEGMSLAAAQAAINAALKIVKDFVNGKVGFALL